MINLKQLRKKHNLTQVQLADLSGYCRRTVQKHERGGVPDKAEAHYIKKWNEYMARKS